MNSNTSRSAPRANTGSAFLDWLCRSLDLPGAPRTPVRSVRAPGVRRRAARSDREADDGPDQPQAPERRIEHRRGTADSGRRGLARLDHRELRQADAPALEARRLRARREHEDARHRARRVHRPRRAPGRTAARHLRPAAHLPRLGPLFRSRPLHHARHRGRRLHEHQHQADGRARSEADGRGEVHPGHVRRLDADLRDAGHQGQRAAADREPEERADLLLPQPPSAAHPRFHHAGAVDQDAEQSVRGAVLQLRAVSARRRAGDAVLGVAEIDEADADPAPAASARRTTICATRWCVARRGRRRARYPPAAADRSAPDADREQRRALAREAVAPRLGRDAAPAAADLQLAGADGVRQAPLVQPVALHPRASPAGQSKPRPPADVPASSRSCGTR